MILLPNQRQPLKQQVCVIDDFALAAGGDVRCKPAGQDVYKRQGLFYAMSSVAAAFILSLAVGPLAVSYTHLISAVSYEMFARIDISDTGTGIPESEQAKIFARFYRSKAVQEQEGVGIGLYLARQILSGEGEMCIRDRLKAFLRI